MNIHSFALNIHVHIYICKLISVLITVNMCISMYAFFWKTGDVRYNVYTISIYIQKELIHGHFYHLEYLIKAVGEFSFLK